MNKINLFLYLFFAMALFAASCKKEDNPAPTRIEDEPGSLWSKNETATEIMRGVRLILQYDASSQAFVGTLENLNTNIAPQVEVKVYVSDGDYVSHEFGPSTPVDMEPGETKDITVPVTSGTDFTKFKINASTKSGDGEGGEEGEEGEEGGEGGEEGNESGLLWNKEDTADEIVNGVHLILDFDTLTESFIGTIENINTILAPQVRVEVHVYQSETSTEEFGPTTPGDMDPGAMRDVTLPITPGTEFVKFNMHPEVGSSGS